MPYDYHDLWQEYLLVHLHQDLLTELSTEAFEPHCQLRAHETGAVGLSSQLSAGDHSGTS